MASIWGQRIFDNSTSLLSIIWLAYLLVIGNALKPSGTTLPLDIRISRNDVSMGTLVTKVVYR